MLQLENTYCNKVNDEFSCSECKFVTKGGTCIRNWLIAEFDEFTRQAKRRLKVERLTMCIDSHLLDNGKINKEYDLNNKIQLNEYSCMDIPNAVYNKLGELEDVLEKYGIENAEDLDKFIYHK